MKQSLRYITALPNKATVFCALLLITASGCRKYLEVPLPIDSIAGSAAFQNDYSSAGALNSIYSALYNQTIFDGGNGLGASMGCLAGLYSDELKNYSVLPSFQAVYANGVSSTLGGVTSFWPTFYGQLYSVNLAIEGLTAAKGLNYRDQWLGEAYFLRGMLYFYLTNLYGDVPLVLSSDYMLNNGLARSPQADVYKQIIADLKQAQSLLPQQYHDVNGLVTSDKGRPNRASASALLARVYLYTKDWANAAAQATNVITDATGYQLLKPAQVFLFNSNEIIWGIVPFQGGLYPYRVKDAVVYFLPAGKTPAAAAVLATLSDSLVRAFEAGDIRYTNWVGIDTVPASGTTPAAIYYFDAKYKATGTYTTPQETVVLFRLAEQYLVRAEARAQQNDVAGALSDLNAIRSRAGLPASTAVTQAAVLTAILKERRVELFMEPGHRFFDLRRTGTIDAVMTTMAPLKGGSWSPFKTWWPIPLTDIQNDTHLVQTPGYQ